MTTSQMATQRGSQDRTITDLVFVGFNSRVIALDRYSGEVVWEWKSPKGTGYVTLLVDGDRLVVSVMGYMYCLDPLFGQEVWSNPLEGKGVGVASVASIHGNAGAQAQVAAAIAQQRQQAAATHSAVVVS